MGDQGINREGGRSVVTIAREIGLSVLCAFAGALGVWIAFDRHQENLPSVFNTVLFCSIGLFAGMILKGLMGQRWRTSTRGLLVATALVAVAVYLIVSRLKS